MGYFDGLVSSVSLKELHILAIVTKFLSQETEMLNRMLFLVKVPGLYCMIHVICAAMTYVHCLGWTMFLNSKNLARVSH